MSKREIKFNPDGTIELDVAIIGAVFSKDYVTLGELKSTLIGLYDGQNWFSIGKCFKGYSKKIKNQILDLPSMSTQPSNIKGGEANLWFENPSIFISIKFKTFKPTKGYELSPQSGKGISVITPTFLKEASSVHEVESFLKVIKK